MVNADNFDVASASSSGERSRIAWYVVHTYSGYENKVAGDIMTKSENDPNVSGKIISAIVPTETVTEIKDGKPKESVRKLYPGYVIVQVKVYYDDDEDEYRMTNETWYVIRNTRGVTGFVGADNRPLPLTPSEVKKLGVEREEVSAGINEGADVEILEGPFAGFVGRVSSVDVANAKLTVVVSMMGGETPVEMPIGAVKSVDG